MEPNEFSKGTEAIYYPAEIDSIKVAPDHYAPIYEAVTNSFESIRSCGPLNAGSVCLEFHFDGGVVDTRFFNKIVITDNGIGLNTENFGRLRRLRDNRKSAKNKGSGRVQYLHFFDKSTYESIYTENGQHYKRTVVLSKAPEFMRENAFLKHIETVPVDTLHQSTKLEFSNLLISSAKPKYESATITDFKNDLLIHYMPYLCANREALPLITIQFVIDGTVVEAESITASDIPESELSETIVLPYSTYSSDSKEIVRIEREEEFSLKLFKIENDRLSTNKLNLTSKGEVREEVKIDIASLSHNRSVEGKRFLFLLSSEYLDQNDGDVRGDFFLPSEKEICDHDNPQEFLVLSEFITKDIVEEKSNETILASCPELQEQLAEHINEVDKLKSMFLLKEEALAPYRSKVKDSNETILKKIYESDAKLLATRDIKLKDTVDKLSLLSPDNESYTTDLQTLVNELVTEIPVQNRVVLTQYVARRKLVLDMFQKIITRELECQAEGNRNIDEALLHNLIFQQHTSDTENSDLWLINEDFLFFKGVSEEQLRNIAVNGYKILREDLSAEEIEYCNSCGENRLAKRPDILLFPEEGRCIIIEFKTPESNVSEHLMQINRYASLLFNLSKPEFKCTAFYGYFIGENINADDVQDHDSDFLPAYHLDYLFRPYKRIRGKFLNDGENASLYTEVTKYSTLLERAKRRNKIFMKKLGIENAD